MARKDVNVFGASFLDLLSGALGAIIILYIIVPKLTVEHSEILEQVDLLQADLSEINGMIEQLQQSVPEALYEELMAQFQAMQDHINTLQQQVRAMEQDLRNTRDENARLEAQVADARQVITDLQAQVADAQRQQDQQSAQFAQMEADLREARELLAKTFLVIYIQWPTRADVDLHVTDPAGAEFSFQNKVIPGRPGELSEDVINGPGAEVWEVRVADPGDYHVQANLYSGETNIEHPVRGRIFFRDGSEPISGVSLRRLREKTTLLRFNVDNEGNVTFR